MTASSVIEGMRVYRDLTQSQNLTKEYLRSLLHYNESTGAFTWVRPPKNHQRMNQKEAGCKSTGYVLIRIDGKKYKAHRLAWLYVYGAMPSAGVDHIDGNTFNNAIVNLRECTQAQNGANAKRWAGKSLPKGVRRNGSGFSARISFQKKIRHIGTFKTPEEAAAAYFAEAKKLYGEFARMA